MPILGTIASSKLDAGDFVSIASTSLTGTTATVTFSSIPSTFAHLQLRLSVRSTPSLERMNMRFNNDSGASSYDVHRLQADGSSAGNDSRIDKDACWLVSAGPLGVTNVADVFTGVIIDILDYTNTNKYKNLKVLCGTDTNSAGSVEFTSGTWKSTSAINRIDMTIPSSNFAQYSTLSLYGIRSA
jgi:hypothetical protein